MKIVFLYGPPAVGKLTTATELKKLTGFQIFHNHISHDFVSSIIDLHSNKKIYYSLIKQINLFFLEKILSSDNLQNLDGLILTYCYEEDKDKNYIDEIKKIVNKLGHQLITVRLFCDNGNLFERVKNESRSNSSKIKDTEVLKNLLEKSNYHKDIDSTYNISIDNSNLESINVAKIIKKYIEHSFI